MAGDFYTAVALLELGLPFLLLAQEPVLHDEQERIQRLHALQSSLGQP